MDVAANIGSRLKVRGQGPAPAFILAFRYE